MKDHKAKNTKTLSSRQAKENRNKMGKWMQNEQE